MLADSQAELLAAWSLVKDTVKHFETSPQGHNDPERSMQVSCAKLFATEMLCRVADRGVQIHGGSGYMNEYPVERFYRDARLLRLYEGTSQIQQLIIGREMLRNI
jgi:acyl-CoA dehydrogenase